MNGRPHAKNNRHENAKKKQVERHSSSHRNLPPTGPALAELCNHL